VAREVGVEGRSADKPTCGRRGTWKGIEATSTCWRPTDTQGRDIAEVATAGTKGDLTRPFRSMQR